MRTYDATYVTYIFRGLLSNNIGDSQAKPAVSLDIGGSFQLPGALANAIALWLVRRTTFLGLENLAVFLRFIDGFSSDEKPRLTRQMIYTHTL